MQTTNQRNRGNNSSSNAYVRYVPRSLQVHLHCRVTYFMLQILMVCYVCTIQSRSIYKAPCQMLKMPLGNIKHKSAHPLGMLNKLAGFGLPSCTCGGHCGRWCWLPSCLVLVYWDPMQGTPMVWKGGIKEAIFERKEAQSSTEDTIW